MCRMKHRSTKESVLWSLDHVCTSKNDAPKGGTTPERRRHPIIRSRVSPEGSREWFELLNGDAFKKGTTQIAPPPPALADAEGKFSPRSVRRDPTLVHGPPSPPAPPGRTLEHRQISEPPAPPHPDRRPRRAAAIPRAVRVRDEVADTSILHHAFISIFIALWTVISLYVTILMAILSYFTRFT